MAPKAPMQTEPDSDSLHEDRGRERGRRQGPDGDADNLLRGDSDNNDSSNNDDDDDHQHPPTISLCRQLAVCAGLLANDGGLVFMQLAMLPCLQTLGVPVSLVTVPGCLSGSLALVGLSLLGRVSDGGSHPHRRKKPAVVMSALLFMAGHALVASGCATHMWWGRGPGPTTLPSATVPVPAAADPDLDPTFLTLPTTTPPSVTVPESEAELAAADGDWFVDPLGLGVPLAGLLSGLGFVFVDMGNDFSNSFLKSLVFASTAKTQHVSLLVVGLLMSAVGGCLAAVLGLFDVGAWLTDGTDLEAVPAKTLLESAFFVMLTFVCTLVSVISSLPLQPRASGMKPSSGDPISSRQPNYGTLQHDPEKAHVIHVTSALDVSAMESGELDTGHSETKLTFERQTDENSNCSSQETDSRASFSLSRSNLTESEMSRPQTPDDSEDTAHLMKDGELENQSLLRSGKEEYSLATFLRSFTRTGSSVTMTNNGKRSPASSSIEYAELHDEASSLESDGSTNDFSRISREENSSKPTAHAEQLDTNGSFGRNCCKTLTRKTWKLALICTSMFFMAGAWQSFNICTTDYLGKVIYGGDPEADPNSQSYAAYQQGMRTGSFGVLLLNVSYVIVNLLQRKLLAVAGPKAEYLVVCAAQVGLLMTLQFTDSVIVFFVTTVVVGIFRSAMYTIPFMLANDLCHEEAKSLSAGKGGARVGRTMAVVTSMLSLSYVIVSSLTGPVIHASGDPASPMYYAVACTFTAAVVFAFT